jgi:hypothetical protein
LEEDGLEDAAEEAAGLGPKEEEPVMEEEEDAVGYASLPVLTRLLHSLGPILCPGCGVL